MVISEEDLLGFGGHLDVGVVGVGGEVLDGLVVGGVDDVDVAAGLGDEQVALEVEDLVGQGGQRDVPVADVSVAGGHNQQQDDR